MNNDRTILENVPDVKLLVSNYLDVRQKTEDLCAPLKAEDMVVQPVEFVSPAKWHLGHTSWFFEVFILEKYFQGYETYNEAFAFIFNSYYNAMGSRVLRHERGGLTRPTVQEVLDYRRYVDQNLKMFLHSPDVTSEALELLEIGVNHEQQHQELLITDIKYVLGGNPLMPAYDHETNLVQTLNEREESLVVVEEGVYEIGHAGDDFSYDNESGRHRVYLHEYAISNHLVINQEFIEFIQDDGYKRSELWLDEGWSWAVENEIKAPLYWKENNGNWYQYTLNGFVPVNPHAQLAHISFYEAAAFAEWKGMRLPTEQEWEVAQEHFKWGTRWEWTNSAYLPYPGYSKPDGAVGEYNGKFMINQMVLRGASTATAANHSRKTYRNFFHPNLRWQVTGIRLVKK